MKRGLLKTMGLICFCAAAIAVGRGPSVTAEASQGPGYQTSSSLLVKVDGMNPELFAEPDTEAEVVGEASTGNTYQVIELVNDSWVKIAVGETEGYLNTVQAATVAETAEEVKDTSAIRRQELVNYAKQFVGGRYVYGGTNPNSGVDCSGFTAYVMKHSAGVSLPHSSAGQAGCGRVISAAEIRPGDLVFYSSGSRINHVAMYIGDGQVVPASNERIGITISNWTYRSPYKIVNVLGD